jgi:hypothetical protein
LAFFDAAFGDADFRFRLFSNAAISSKQSRFSIGSLVSTL